MYIYCSVRYRTLRLCSKIHCQCWKSIVHVT